MTHRLLILTILTGALLFSGLIAGPLAPSAGATMMPASIRERAEADGPRFEVRLGDGVFRILLRGCETCPTAISVRIELSALWRQ